MPNNRFIYEIPFFDGGLHNKSNSHVIDVAESPDTLNCDTEDTGAIRTRYGSTALTIQTLGTGTFYGATSFQPTSGDSQLICWYNSSMMYLTTGTTLITVPSADGVFTNQTNIVYAPYNGYLYMSDGGTPYKWNGSDFTRHKIETPSAALVSTATTAGPNTGVYMWKFTYVNSDLVVGDLGSAVTIDFGTTSSIASLTGIPTAPVSYGVVRRQVHRTKTGGTTYYYVDEIADNSTTTYKDETSDTDLVTLSDTDAGGPADYTLIKAHKDRLWIVDPDNPSNVFYSEIGNPYTFKAANFELAGKGDGKITSLGVTSDALVMIKNTNEVFMLYLADNDPANYILLKTNTSYGSNAQFNVTFQDQLMYLGMIADNATGFVTLSGINPTNEAISTDIGGIRTEIASFRIEPDILNFSKAAFNDINGVHWKNKIYITVPYSNATNNRIYVYDYQRRTLPKQIGSWLPWTGLSIGHLFVFDNKLFGTTSGEGVGQILELDKTSLYSDSGSAINSYFETKYFHTDDKHAQNHKDFRGVYIWATLLGNWNANVYSKTDFEPGDGELSQINLLSSGGLWDTAIWDVDIFGANDTEKEFYVDLGTTNGRRIKFKFTNQNTAGQAFKISRAAIEYILRARRRASA